MVGFELFVSIVFVRWYGSEYIKDVIIDKYDFLFNYVIRIELVVNFG